ncbi:MAG: rhodanese-like domain-containing protein [Eubacteriales bacterium]|nr:rhodanese-like domain-containing protein [Eubacteriales bacterium]
MRIDFRLIAALGVLLFLTGCGGEKAPTYRQVSPDEAAAMMETETDCIILDVRTQAEYEQGHIPGAICVPNETIGTGEIPQLPDKGQLILVYCRSGNRSKQAAQKLADLGYTNIAEFGGILSWTGETVSGEWS